ncbi:MAG: pantetheine-phosphate adenylyltransferase [Clostridia bacterium]|nr:pantetheine-phosphate adenylyltransferase [Clostridia bacterium]
MSKARIAIVTGSFDPITVGHVEIVRRAAEMFDRVYVVALSNEEKTHMFSSSERKEMIRLATEDISGAIADAYEGMTADYMHVHGITTIVRGVRGEQDRAYEQYVAKCMRAFDPAFETVFVEAADKWANVSSTLVRRRIRAGESICDLVPDKVEAYIKSLQK